MDQKEIIEKLIEIFKIQSQLYEAIYDKDKLISRLSIGSLSKAGLFDTYSMDDLTDPLATLSNISTSKISNLLMNCLKQYRTENKGEFEDY